MVLSTMRQVRQRALCHVPPADERNLIESSASGAQYCGEVNVAQMLLNAARRTPDAPAITQGSVHRTYAELEARSDALANGLLNLGVAFGDRVGLLMANRPELIEAMYACFRIGACVVPLNARFTEEEVVYHLEDSGAAAILCDEDGFAGAVATYAGPARVVVTGTTSPATGVTSLEALIDASERTGGAVLVDRDDLAWLFYTSGTTGRPKGAMLTHGNLAFVVASWLADLTPMAEGDVTLHAAPLSHGAGFHALAATARGAHHVLPESPHFDPAAMMTLLREAKVANTWMVPTQIVMLADHLAEHPDDELVDLRAIVYGGAPFPEPELRKALDVLGPVLVQLYAQGETPMTATVLPAADHVRIVAEGTDQLASAGFARPGMDVRVLDERSQPAAVGAVGEICVRGPAVMLGYWQRDEATAETLRNGWLHTGDLGRMDEQGYIFLMDRAKDMIITGGSNVYAVEVEAVIAAVEGIKEVAVVGIADRKWGEIVTAVLVPEDGVTIDLEALAAHCAASMTSYKCPRRWEQLDELPRNAYGKVLKRELRERLSA